MTAVPLIEIYWPGWTIRPWITSVEIGLVGKPSNAGFAYTVMGGITIE